MSTDIARNRQEINQQIQDICERCGRSSEEITLVAISKTKPVEDIRAAVDLGLRHIGENKVQELTEKMDQLPDERIHWHMVGQLQTNKIKYLVNRVDWIQTVPKKKAFQELEKRAAEVNRTINTLVQVNISDEEQKSGCPPEELESLLEYASGLQHVQVKGLMGIATLTEDREQIRKEFRSLRELRDHFRKQFSGPVDLEHLSMGMTHDMDIAIEEGATMIRIGTAIFGARDYSKAH